MPAGARGKPFLALSISAPSAGTAGSGSKSNNLLVHGRRPARRSSSCPRSVGPRCVAASIISLRLESGTTKHRRNFASKDHKIHNVNLILKRAARVRVTLCFLFIEPIPCLADICSIFQRPVASWKLCPSLGRCSRETGMLPDGPNFCCHR